MSALIKVQLQFTYYIPQKNIDTDHVGRYSAKS